MMAFCPEHPKWDQNPKFTLLSETTSIPTLFICRVPTPPPPRERWSQAEVQLYLSIYQRVWNELVISYVYIRFLYFCNRLIPKLYPATTWRKGSLFSELNDAFYHYFMIVMTWTFFISFSVFLLFLITFKSKLTSSKRNTLYNSNSGFAHQQEPTCLAQSLHVDLF